MEMKMIRTKRRRMMRGTDERSDDDDDDETKVAILSSEKKEVYDGCSSSTRSKSCHWATSCVSTSPRPEGDKRYWKQMLGMGEAEWQRRVRVEVCV